MNYESHLNTIKAILPELDLVKKNEMFFFKNQKFGINCIKNCIKLCNESSQRLGISVNFGVKLDYTFNAQVKFKKECNILLFNLGLFEKLEDIISDSINIFSTENLARFTINKQEKIKLKKTLSELCLSYLFYHELAHVLQKINTNFFKKCSLREESFDIKNHIYEFDADYFGVSMSTYKLIEYLRSKDYTINNVQLFDYLTVLLFCIDNIIILFSNYNLKDIYYKKFKHPHPVIRILSCNEQILYLISVNLNIKKEVLFAISQRTYSMINQIKYGHKDKIDYLEIVKKNSRDIEKYTNEIDVLNESYEELTRFRVQEIMKKIIT